MKRARSNSSSYAPRPYKSSVNTNRSVPRDINAHDTTLAQAPVKQPGEGAAPGATALTDFGSLVSAIPRGNTSITRLGRTARLLSIYGEITLHADTASGASDCVLNVALIYEKSHQKKSTAPNLSDIYEVGDSTSNLFRKLDEVKNYSVLMRKTIEPDRTLVSGSVQADAHHFSFKHKFKKEGLPFNYDGVDGTIGQCVDGALYLVAFANELSTASKLEWSARTRIKFMP